MKILVDAKQDCPRCHQQEICRHGDVTDIHSLTICINLPPVLLSAELLENGEHMGKLVRDMSKPLNFGVS